MWFLWRGGLRAFVCVGGFGALHVVLGCLGWWAGFGLSVGFGCW